MPDEAGDDRGDQVFCYPLKGRAAPTVFANVQRRTPTARMVNGDDSAIDEAVTLMIAQSEGDMA